MSAINFNLKNASSINRTTINLIFRWNESKNKISTRMHIHPKDWNFTRQRVKKGKQSSVTINQLLDSYEIKLNLLILKHDASTEIITTYDIKSELFGIQENIKHTQSLLSYMDSYISVKKEVWRRSTYNSYCNTHRKLRTFYQYSGLKDNFKAIDQNFYGRFTQYLFSPPRNYSINNVGKHIQNLKAVLNASVMDGQNNNLKFKHHSFKKLHQKVTNIYLTINELQQIRTAKIESSKLSKARDILIVLCFTGLRFSDVFKVNEKAIRVVDTDSSKIKFLEILTMKTSKTVSIPLHPYVEEILIHYNYQLPIFSNPKLNEYIKEVAKIAGINRMVSITSSKAGRAKVITKPKYNFVCTHTGRRSFITNLYLAKVDTRSIRMISGHSSESEFNRYIKVGLKESTITLASHDFFQP